SPPPEHQDFVTEENRLYDALENARFMYLVCEAKKDDYKPEEHVSRRQEYETALSDFLMHKCAYALTEGPKLETRTMGEHLLEIIASVVNHDTERRQHVYHQITDDKLLNKVIKEIEKRPVLKFTIAAALGALAWTSTRSFHLLPEDVETGVEYLGYTIDGINATLGTFVAYRALLRRGQAKRSKERLVKSQDSMLEDPNATSRF